MPIPQENHLLHIGREYPLVYTKFTPRGEVKKTLLISSATGVPQEFYRKFARYLAENGIATYTFDYSGMGRSGGTAVGMKSHKGGLKSWGSRDQAEMVALILKEYPDLKINLATHSIGGQILGFNALNHHFDKVIMVASQNAGQYSYSGFSLFKIMLFFNLFIPVLTPIFGYYPGSKIGIFEDLPGSMALEWGKWGRKKNYMMHYRNQKDYFFDGLKAKVRSYSFANDWLATKFGVDWLAEQYGNAQVERLHYSEKVNGQEPKHFGFFKEHFKATFWEPTATWLLE